MEVVCRTELGAGVLAGELDGVGELTDCCADKSKAAEGISVIAEVPSGSGMLTTAFAPFRDRSWIARPGASVVIWPLSVRVVAVLILAVAPGELSARTVAGAKKKAKRSRAVHFIRQFILHEGIAARVTDFIRLNCGDGRIIKGAF